ncbi:site-specific integrase [Acidobacteria bacterium AH-259-O06]|nr:site-specific integrase [Acidobacteria bacterium AH-259-O06]
MGVNEWRDRRGKKRIYVTKQWPDRTRFKRVAANKTQASNLLKRIENSIVMGTWRELKAELARGIPVGNPTIEELSGIYLREYCRPKNRDVQFKERQLAVIIRLVGKVRVKELARTHAYEFITRRLKEVSPASVNRGLAVLKHLMTFALDKGHIDTHPLQRFSLLPEPQKALRVMTLQEERNLVEAVGAEDIAIGAYIALLGQTALRKAEGLKLEWQHIDAKGRLLTVEWPTKSGKIRHVPLSQYALEWLSKLDRIVGLPWVFVKNDRTRWLDPRGPFEKGKKCIGMDWVTFHDCRHFRATQWVRLGLDLRTVQGLLGHSSLHTTMRYAHFVESHAMRSVREVESIERSQLEEIFKRDESGTTVS